MTGFPCNRSGIQRRLGGLLAASGLVFGLSLQPLYADFIQLALSNPTDLTPAPAGSNGATQPPLLPAPGAPAGNPPSASSPSSNPPGGSQTINATPLPPIGGQPASPSAAPPVVGQPGGTSLPPLPPLSPLPTLPPLPSAAGSSATQNGAIGLLDEAHHGLGANLWLGSQLSFLMTLMPKLPAPVSEPALRDLQLRLLLTAAASPGATAGLDPLISLRAERLHAMGFDGEALALTEAGANAGPMDPQEAVEKLWTAGDNPAACAKVDEEIGKTRTPELYWRKALIFCQILRDNADQAIIGLDLLRERADKDQATKDFIAVAAILSGDAKSKKLKTPITAADPLLAAMLEQAKLPAPDVIGTAPPKPVGPAADAALARDPAQPLGSRIAAAERAFGAGLFKAEDVTALYGQIPPPITDPVAMMNAADSPESRAALYQAVSRGQMPDQRAPMIAAAMQKARQRGDYFTQAQIYAPFAQMIVPNRGLLWFAPEAARLMFAAGNADKAGFWLTMVQTAQGDPQAATAAPGLKILARLAGASTILGGAEDPVAEWRAAANGSDMQGARLYALFAGLGQKVGGGWTGISPIVTQGSYAAQINAAAPTGRRGETVLLSLLALGGNRLGDADAASLSAAIGGLRAVGLEAEARRIALEAAILSGL